MKLVFENGLPLNIFEEEGLTEFKIGSVFISC